MYENSAVSFYREKQSLLTVELKNLTTQSKGKSPCGFDVAFLSNVFEWLRNCVQETIEPGISCFDQNTEKRS